MDYIIEAKYHDDVFGVVGRATELSGGKVVPGTQRECCISASGAGLPIFGGALVAWEKTPKEMEEMKETCRAHGKWVKVYSDAEAT